MQDGIRERGEVLGFQVLGDVVGDVDEKPVLGVNPGPLGVLNVHGGAPLGGRLFRVVGIVGSPPETAFRPAVDLVDLHAVVLVARVYLHVHAVATGPVQAFCTGHVVRGDLEGACHDVNVGERY